MTYHKINYERGNDPRSHIVRCACGWEHCSTYRQCQLHGAWHIEDAVEDKTWCDPTRNYQSRQ